MACYQLELTDFHNPRDYRQLNAFLQSGGTVHLIQCEGNAVRIKTAQPIEQVVSEIISEGWKVASVEAIEYSNPTVIINKAFLLSFVYKPQKIQSFISDLSKMNGIENCTYHVPLNTIFLSFNRYLLHENEINLFFKQNKIFFIRDVENEIPLLIVPIRFSLYSLPFLCFFELIFFKWFPFMGIFTGLFYLIYLYTLFSKKGIYSWQSILAAPLANYRIWCPHFFVLFFLIIDTFSPASTKFLAWATLLGVFEPLGLSLMHSQWCRKRIFKQVDPWKDLPITGVISKNIMDPKIFLKAISIAPVFLFFILLAEIIFHFNYIHYAPHWNFYFFIGLFMILNPDFYFRMLNGYFALIIDRLRSKGIGLSNAEQLFHLVGIKDIFFNDDTIVDNKEHKLIKSVPSIDFTKHEVIKLAYSLSIWGNHDNDRKISALAQEYQLVPYQTSQCLAVSEIDKQAIVSINGTESLARLGSLDWVKGLSIKPGDLYHQALEYENNGREVWVICIDNRWVGLLVFQICINADCKLVINTLRDKGYRLSWIVPYYHQYMHYLDVDLGLESIIPLKSFKDFGDSDRIVLTHAINPFFYGKNLLIPVLITKNQIEGPGWVHGVVLTLADGESFIYLLEQASIFIKHLRRLKNGIAAWILVWILVMFIPGISPHVWIMGWMGGLFCLFLNRERGSEQ